MWLKVKSLAVRPCLRQECVSHMCRQLEPILELFGRAVWQVHKSAFRNQEGAALGFRELYPSQGQERGGSRSIHSSSQFTMNGSRDVGTAGQKCFSRTGTAGAGAQDSRRAGPAPGPRGQVQPQGASPCAPSPSRRLPGSPKVVEPRPAGSREPRGGGGGGGGVAAVLSPRGRGERGGPAAALSSASRTACGRAGAGRRRPRSDM